MSREIIDNDDLDDNSYLERLSDFQLIGIIEEQKQYGPLVISAVKSALIKRNFTEEQRIALHKKYRDDLTNSKFKLNKSVIIALIFIMLLTFGMLRMTQIFVILIIAGSLVAVIYKFRGR